MRLKKKKKKKEIKEINETLILHVKVCKGVPDKSAEIQRALSLSLSQWSEQTTRYQEPAISGPRIAPNCPVTRVVLRVAKSSMNISSQQALARVSSELGCQNDLRNDFSFLLPDPHESHTRGARSR